MAAAIQTKISSISNFSHLKNHPMFQEIKSYGYENIGQQTACFQVYMDLCEVRQWYNVTMHPCESLQMVFISGQWRPSDPFEVVLPLRSEMVLSLEKIEQYIKRIRPPDETFSTKSLTLAIVDKDTTTVYYRVSSGLVPPDSAEVNQAKKRKHREAFQNRQEMEKWALANYEQDFVRSAEREHEEAEHLDQPDRCSANIAERGHEGAEHSDYIN